MKNQYFGDINDYKKYGLIKLLSGHGQLKTVVCWMLTRDDERSDGNRIAYLHQPEKWRNYDPTLYDYLEESIVQLENRNISVIETCDIFLDFRYYSEIIEDNVVSQEAYFGRFLDFAKGSDLIFFDPDNGLQVKSVPRGKKNSSKYLYWNEVKSSYKAGHSLLIYQHFPRMNRESYIANLIKQFSAIADVSRIFYYQTRHVVFFLLPQLKHETFFIDRNADILNTWRNTINIYELPLKKGAF